MSRWVIKYSNESYPVMKEVFDENMSGTNGNINCTKAHEYTEWYKISVIEMTDTVIYPCCYSVNKVKETTNIN